MIKLRSNIFLPILFSAACGLSFRTYSMPVTDAQLIATNATLTSFYASYIGENTKTAVNRVKEAVDRYEYLMKIVTLISHTLSIVSNTESIILNTKKLNDMVNGSRLKQDTVNPKPLEKSIDSNYQNVLKAGYENSPSIAKSVNPLEIGVSGSLKNSNENTAFAGMANQAAINRAVSEKAFNVSSNRIEKIEELHKLIYVSGDIKYIADVSARIQAEQLMTQNESNKIATLGQLAQSQRDLQEVSARSVSIQRGVQGLAGGW